MGRDAAATRARLLKAGTAEFAAYGIAGARVDRIAAAASANKNLIYIYFGNKEQLFDAVFEAAIAELLDAAPFDAADLPAYAGALSDFYRAHPHLIRLARWHSLERSGAPQLPIAQASTKEKLAALAAAQATGQIDAGLPPEDLLTLVLTVAGAWSDGAPEPPGGPAGDEALARRRQAIMVSVGRLTRPTALAERG